MKKLDWARLLGFNQIEDRRGEKRISGKVGGKLGGKGGVKA